MRTARAIFAVGAVCLGAIAAPATALAFGPLSGFGSRGEAAGQMHAPAGIAIGADGSVYIADILNNRVDVFSRSGTFVRAFGKGVNPLDGSGVCTLQSGCKKGIGDGSAGSAFLPQGVAIDESGGGLLYVSDSVNNRIDVFDPAGSFVRAFGKAVNVDDGSDVCTVNCRAGVGSSQAGAIDIPTGLDFGADGLLYVADRNNNRIDVFAPAGTFVRAIGLDVGGADVGVCTTTCLPGRTSSEAGAMLRPRDVKSGPEGQLAVSDFDNNRIDVYRPNGDFVRAFGKGVNALDGTDVCAGTEPSCRGGVPDNRAGALREPAGIAIDRNGRIFVAEPGNNRISEFGFDGGFIRAFGEGVLSGASAFEICSLATDCLAGGEQPVPGATPGPFGVAVDGSGTVYVAEQGAGMDRIDRFGEPESTVPNNEFGLGKLKLNRRRGTATLIATVPGPGTLVLRGKGIHLFKATAKAAGNVRLAVRLVGGAKRRLTRTGRAKVRALVTFSPTGGTPRTKARVLGLRKTLRRRSIR